MTRGNPSFHIPCRNPGIVAEYTLAFRLRVPNCDLSEKFVCAHSGSTTKPAFISKPGDIEGIPQWRNIEPLLLPEMLFLMLFLGVP
jgi:hypothetical protein